MSVTTSTDNLGLTKYWRGHPIRDTDIADNMDILDAAYQGGVKVAKGELTAGDANAFAFAWQNPESSVILVQRVIIDITTAGGTGSSVLDVGVVANATSTAADIFNDIDLNSAATLDHMLVAGAGVGGVHRVDENGGTNDYITGKILTQNAASLVGKYYIEYMVV